MMRQGWREHSTNLVGIPTGLLASLAYNERPLPLHISGARETNPVLFEMLDQAAHPEEAAEAFEKYMDAVFAIDHPLPPAAGRRRYRSSYRQLLEGWGYDANGPAGAVLKGWVESRFGLIPEYHKTRLGRVGSAGWANYVEEKMSSRYHNNSINDQLDLMYEFCQWSLARFFNPGCQHINLFRGINDFTEHEIVEHATRRSVVIRMNNLISFTADRSIADAFGDIILDVRVPTTKILFFRELIPSHPLTGEAEYLAVGGEYLASLHYL